MRNRAREEGMSPDTIRRLCESPLSTLVVKRGAPHVESAPFERLIAPADGNSPKQAGATHILDKADPGSKEWREGVAAVLSNCLHEADATS